MKRDAVIACFAEDRPAAEHVAWAGGQVCFVCAACPERGDPNEDSLAFISVDDKRAVILLADGFGGEPAGDRASREALTAMIDAVEAALADGQELQSGLMAGFDRANAEVQAMGVGAATTLAAVEIDNGRVRPYHVGDSEILVVGQRGRRRLATISHSPVGYSLEAGVLSDQEALHHEERHVVSNMVGSGDMRIDVGPALEMNARDTLLVASDGLWDNLFVDEIVELIRKGPLKKQADALRARCHAQMAGEGEGPSKPDDLSFVLYRPN